MFALCTPPPLRIALYARVSTSDQSLDPLLDVLRRYAEARGREAREFAYHGQSGRNDQPRSGQVARHFGHFVILLFIAPREDRDHGSAGRFIFLPGLGIDDLKRRGQLEPDASCCGSWVWYERPSGRRLGTVGYEVETAGTHGTLRLRYTVSSRRRAGSLRHDYIVDLVTTRPHFGGLRWWFLCPLSGRRVRKLYAHPRSSYFASREALGLTYQVCREEPLERAARRVWEPGVPSIWASGLPTLSGVT